jgi:hypothetical protein
LDQAKEAILLDFGDRPILLLHMISATRGFFLEHPATREHESHIISFSVHHFYHQDNGKWQQEQLFTMRIPCTLLFDEQFKLHESLVPLIPYYHENTFYFCSCPPDCEQLAIYSYDFRSKNVELMAQAPYHLLAPIVLQQYLVYGMIDYCKEGAQLHCKSLPQLDKLLL